MVITVMLVLATLLTDIAYVADRSAHPAGLMDSDIDPGLVSNPIADTAVPRRPPSGVWRQSWHRFRRNRAGMIGLFLVTLVVLTAILGPFAAPYDPNDHSAMMRGAANAAPSARNWLGTDRNGYDVLSRAIYGAPTALAVGLGAMLIASLIGVLRRRRCRLSSAASPTRR